MSVFSRRAFLATSIAATACTPYYVPITASAETFICPPCGCSEDETLFSEPGHCPDCGMFLSPISQTDLGYEPTVLTARAGHFEVSGGSGREQARIQVHFNKPDNFSATSKILLIIPGAGRNSADYRNAWLAYARQNNVLIAALGYPEATYDFGAYHMGGVIRNIEFIGLVAETNTSGTNVLNLRDEDIKFEINPNAQEWLFHDFDRVFSLLATASGSNQRTYDIFGHSAGGQILHRFALFHPSSLANQIIAANAGFYTLPTLDRAPPTGLANTGVTTEILANAFASKLTILLGEEDDGDLAGGTILHTPQIDEQGMGRLARGRHFFHAAETQAEALGAQFNWKIDTVPGVGHDFAAISQAASEILLG